jgi:NDP-sugar pyrophosphorylase family protein
MTVIGYQAQVADGIRKKGIKRANSFFKTPEEAVEEAFSLKEKLDTRYKNQIKWDYSKKITGTLEKMKILKGYLDGDEDSSAFYLQITTSEIQRNLKLSTPSKPKKFTTNDKKVMTKVAKIFV